MVSRYNIYFNGKESLKAGEKKIETELQDDYSNLLPVYKSALAETENISASNMGYAIEKSDKLIRLHSITAKPKRRKNRSESYKKLANKEEYNNWVDDSHILAGKSHYYLKDYIQAAEEFDYVLRKFAGDPEVYYQALIWLLRCQTALQMNDQALEIIGEIEGSLQFPEQLNADFDIAAANFYIAQKEHAKAIAHLELAVQNTTKKTERTRCHYILAQLYELDNQNSQASYHYRKVESMNGPYLLRFSAQLSALRISANNDNRSEIHDQLNKLLKSERNTDYKDQIYYALAQIELQTNNEPTAIQYLQKSVAAHTSNDNQLILSCQDLSNLFYKREEYIDARSYYDTLFTTINSSHPNYGELSLRYKNLISLTDNLLIVQCEDSLQRLAKMSDEQLNKLVKGWIAQKETKNQLAEIQAQQQANDAVLAEQMNRTSKTSTWYFYNDQAVNIGRQQFVKNWGKRRLEDNWRRSNKNATQFEEEIVLDEKALTDDALNENKPTRNTNEMDVAFYLQDVPKTAEALQNSNDKILDALFRAGRIFKHDFDNQNKSIATYEDLLKRFYENRYQLPVYFEQWDSNLKIQNQERADYYRQLILNKYPQSKYAAYLTNPNYFIELEEQKQKEELAFQDALGQYQTGNYASAAQKAKALIAQKPDSSLIPQLEFMQLIGENKGKDKATFDAQLANYSQRYPTSNLSGLADNIRALLPNEQLNSYQAMIDSGYISEEIYRKVETQSNDDFKVDENSLHFFVIAYSNNKEIDVNRLRFDVANYNIDHYLKTDFDMETAVLNAQTSMLIVKTFLDKDQALVYLRSIIRKPKVFEQVHAKEYANFVISSENFRLMNAKNNLAEYLAFHKQHYSKFTAGNFPEEELFSPEELAEQLAKQKEAPKEVGSFVEIDVKDNLKAESASSAAQNETAFQKESKVAHQLVIAVNDRTVNVESCIRGLNEFNKVNQAELGLHVHAQVVGNYQLICVDGLSDATQAMDYFRKVIINRNLFSGFGSASYRNFVISSSNLKLITTGKLTVDQYTTIFREYYLSKEYMN